MRLSSEQLQQLSQLFLDLAKGLFLSSLVVTAISPAASTVIISRGLIGGLIFTYLSLKTLELKEVA